MNSGGANGVGATPSRSAAGSLTAGAAPHHPSNLATDGGGGGRAAPNPRSRHQRTPSDSFAHRLLAPASHWYDEMRWSRKHRGQMTNGKRLELIASYAPDWVLTLLTAGLLQLINSVYGFRREFSLTDTSIQHTYAVHERVSVGLLAVIAFIVPLVLMAVISLGISRSVWDFHAGLLGLVVAHAFALTATTIVKVTVGRPRPDFLDRCKPASGAQNGSPFGLATQSVCTTDVNSHLISDGFRSFPSGHASTAFAGLTFFTLWLAGKFHIWQRSRGNAFSAWILFFPMIAATLIAVSRTMDYRHHATDVIAGGILGFVVALSAYHNYYPPLWHYQSHKPWSPRTTFAHSYLHNGERDDAVDIERDPLRHAAGEQDHTYSSDESHGNPAAAHFARKDRTADGVPYTDRSPSDEVEMSRPITAEIRPA